MYTQDTPFNPPTHPTNPSTYPTNPSTYPTNPFTYPTYPTNPPTNPTHPTTHPDHPSGVMSKINIKDLIYWKDVRLTGAVFFSSFVFLLSLALYSVLSVLSYILLVTLTITFTYKIYKSVVSAIRKTGESTPFKKYLELDIGINETNAPKVTQFLTHYLSYCLDSLRNLLLLKDMVDSLQFGLVLWLMTYIGSCFNGMTLIIIADVAVFTVPMFCEVYKAEINQHWSVVQNKFKDLLNMVQEKVKQISPLKKKIQ